MLRVGLVLLAMTAGGCDVVWGLTGEPPACDLGEAAFDDAVMTPLVTAEELSVAVDNDRAVGLQDGLAFELELDFGSSPSPVTLGPEGYMPVGLGLAPEGDFLFFARHAEPPDLQMATRTSDGWVVSALPRPAGERAGTPTARVFGPRRVLVKIGGEGIVDDGTEVRDVQEYVEDGRIWRPVGSLQVMPGSLAPNLTPNGMTAVFVERDDEGNHFVVIARRDHVSDSFEGRTRILRSEPDLPIFSAQLHGADSLDKECTTLFVNVGHELRRYTR